MGSVLDGVRLPMSLPNEAIEEAAGGEAAEAKEEASKACGFEVRGRMLIWVSKK